MSERNRQWLFPIVAVLLGVGLPYLAVEGIYALAGGAQAKTSLAYDLYARWFADPVIPDEDPLDPSTKMITHLSQLTSQFDAFKVHGVGIGNSPFKELKSERVALNSEENGCKVQKPNLRKTVSYLRSNLFNPFDQLSCFYDADTDLSPDLERFFARYQFRQVRHSSNEYGERITLPATRSDATVLIAGDSVANGVMLDDSETLASQLQANDPSRQYVNLGISGARAADILCVLDAAAERYAGQIRQLIYVFCENDFEEDDRYVPPSEVIDRLVAFQRREGIDEVILVYAPYIYNVVPEITRVHGHSHSDWPSYRKEKRQLLALAEAAGFSVIDYLDVAREQEAEVASQFAPLALFIDHAHHSRLGVAKLARRLRSGSATARSE